MALDIVLSIGGKARQWNDDTSISFEGGEADYWYLWPTLIAEVKKATGQLIDLYDDAMFSGDDLDRVEGLTLIALQQLASIKNERWQVHTGTQTHPVREEIYRTLVKKDLRQKLEKLVSMLRLAKERGEKVICIGD